MKGLTNVAAVHFGGPDSVAVRTDRTLWMARVRASSRTAPVAGTVVGPHSGNRGPSYRPSASDAVAEDAVRLRAQSIDSWNTSSREKLDARLDPSLRGQVAEPVGRRDPTIHEEVEATRPPVSWRGLCSARPRVAEAGVRTGRRAAGFSRDRQASVSLSAAPRRLDGGDVDLLHRHHRLEATPCLLATGRQRLGQHARRDLPGEPPAILAPTAGAFLAAIADDRVPVAVGLRPDCPSRPGRKRPRWAKTPGRR